jgi:hypothetical protein
VFQRIRKILGIATPLLVIPGILPFTFQAAFHAFKIVPDNFVSQ